MKNLQASVSEIVSKDGWYHLMPLGRVERAHDGRGPYELKDTTAVIEASMRDKVDLFVDRDHQAFFVQPGVETVAAGWIKKLEARDDGIWARIEWTPRAQKQIDDKEYRYLSPVFTYNAKTGEVIAIKHASLTINPNFELTAIASAQNDSSTQAKEVTMTLEELIKKLAALLGLEGEPTADDIVTAVTDRTQALASASADLKTLRKTLKVDAKADSQVMLAAAAALVTGKATVDPNAYVPMSAFTEVRDNLAALQTKLAQGDAETAVASAMRAGKVTPAQKEWALSYASADPKAFQEYLKNAPRIAIAAAAAEGAPDKGKEEDVDLTKDQKEILAALNVDEGEAKKILAEQKAD